MKKFLTLLLVTLSINGFAQQKVTWHTDVEKAVEIYDKVLRLEPDNAWARDARRRYQRYVGRD